MAASITTPSKRFAAATAKFWRLFQKLCADPDGKCYATGRVAAMLGELAEACEKLSHRTDVIARKNNDKMMCLDLSVAARKRERHQSRWGCRSPDYEELAREIIIKRWTKVEAAIKEATATTTATTVAEPAASAAPATPGAPSAAATAFHRFPSLPVELRLMVWEAAARPPCDHVVTILETARRRTRTDARGGAAQTPATHACDPAGLLFLEDLGLWTACSESRAAVKRIYARLMPAVPNANFVDHSKLTMQGWRVGFMNRLALKFQRDVTRLHRDVKKHCLISEHRLRQQKKGNNVILEVLRELYELDDDLPLGADDGPIPAGALKRPCPDLRIGYLLGVPWG